MKLTTLLLLALAAAIGQAPPTIEETADTGKCGARQTGAEKTAAAAAGGDRTVIESALVTIIEEVEIPAKVEGVLSAVEAREGQMVEAGGVVARIEDVEARLTHDRAKTEFEIARKQADNDLKVRLARKSTDVAKAELRRSLESVEKYKKA